MPGAAVADAILTSGRMNMDDVFSPEAVYASWMNMSYFALTAGINAYNDMVKLFKETYSE